MEVIHFCLVKIELDPNLGPPSGEVGEESFQFRIIFDNDGNIININVDPSYHNTVPQLRQPLREVYCILRQVS